MKKRAIVCVTNDLATDQRVNKTCLTLQKCGYDVIETGRLLPRSLPLERPYSTRRPKLWLKTGPLFYAEYNIRLFFYLLFAKVDLIFSNDLDTLPAAFCAAKIRRKRLIYDTHEYFTEMPELVNRPKTQRIWKTFEDLLFPKLIDIITVNESIAKLYSEKYKKNVHIIRNIPPSYTPKQLKTRKELGLPKEKHIIILQGTGINIDRGAEELCLAMQYLDDVLLLIVGDGDVLNTLKKIRLTYKLEEKIAFKSKMTFEELRQYTINSDLGMAIDKDTNINYRYSLPNKLFDYIHSEIPVVASRLVELSRIIDKYDVGYYIENHHPQHIADVISGIFSDKKKYEATKQNTLKAKEELCWENEEKTLISIIQK